MVLRVADRKDNCSDTDAVGVIGVNAYMVDVQAPFGGVKA
jgi:acyl-CoA reductase-like NAD-dependent aldehyde dehydrogenase